VFSTSGACQNALENHFQELPQEEQAAHSSLGKPQPSSSQQRQELLQGLTTRSHSECRSSKGKWVQESSLLGPCLHAVHQEEPTRNESQGDAISLNCLSPPSELSSAPMGPETLPAECSAMSLLQAGEHRAGFSMLGGWRQALVCNHETFTNTQQTEASASSVLQVLERTV